MLDRQTCIKTATSLRFTYCKELVILGGCLTTDADTDRAIEFALIRARGQWIQSMKLLCRRRVPISKRLQNYYATVGKSALHGLEGLPLTQTALKSIMSFDRSCLRAMIAMVKREGEGWVDFRRRQNTLLRRLFTKLGLQELAAQLLAKQHGWAEHVTRMSRNSLAKRCEVAGCWSETGTLEEWRCTQAINSQLDPSNRTKWRHSKKGCSPHWESNLVKVFGDLWRQQAVDRWSWRASRARFVWECCNNLFGIGH